MFTRKYLAGLGLEADKIEAVMEAHVEVVEALKGKIAESGDRAEELAKVQAELRQVKEDLKAARATIEAAEKEDYKGKYESEKAAHEKLVSDIEAEKVAAKKEQALTKAAKAAKYSADAIASILDSKKDYAGRIEFDENGNATNAEEILKAIAADRPGITPKVEKERHTPANPPASDGAKRSLTWEEIDKIKNPVERQKAMLESKESLGI